VDKEKNNSLGLAAGDDGGNFRAGGLPRKAKEGKLLKMADGREELKVCARVLKLVERNVS
jgi:hypothetical protein